MLPKKLSLRLKSSKIKRMERRQRMLEKKYELFLDLASDMSARSLIMEVYDPEYVERLALKKITPKVVNDLALKRHKYGEAKEKAYLLQVSVAEVMIDVCRVNNWTTTRDFKKYKVPYAEVLKELFQVSVEYSDILKYYAKLRFEERQSLA